MIKSAINSLIRSSFKNLLATTYVIGTLLLIAIATLITSNLSTQTVKESLGKTGVQLLDSFANRSRLALLYQSEDEAQLVISSILSFPDVEAAGIYNENTQAISLSDISLELLPLTPSANPVAIHQESEQAWILTSPVYSTTDAEISPFADENFEPQLLGYVQLVISKDALAQLKNDFYKYNLIVIGVLASILLWALLTITNRVTKPLQNLAEDMQKAADGGSKLRANIGGTQDIGFLKSVKMSC